MFDFPDWSDEEINRAMANMKNSEVRRALRVLSNATEEAIEEAHAEQSRG